MITLIVQTLLDLASIALMLLPPCPFLAFFSAVDNIVLSVEVMSYIAWLIPFSAILGLLNMWVNAIIIWYAVRPLLKWAKKAGG